MTSVVEQGGLKLVGTVALWHGEERQLSEAAATVLRTLVQHQGFAVPAHLIAEALNHHRAMPYTFVDEQVAKLKLQFLGAPIHHIPGVGYTWAPTARRPQ